MKKIFENDGTEFSAYHAACRFVASLGFAIGSMERDQPIGLYREPATISKWTRMTQDEHDALDGFLESPDFRTGTVMVTLHDEVIAELGIRVAS